MALRTVAARLAVAMYNEGGALTQNCMHLLGGCMARMVGQGSVDIHRLIHTRTYKHKRNAVARLELVQADASVCVEAALALLPYAEESFQVRPSSVLEHVHMHIYVWAVMSISLSKQCWHVHMYIYMRFTSISLTTHHLPQKQASFKDTMESMLSVAQELRSTEVGAVTAALLAGEGVDGGEEEGGGGKGGGVALASAAAAAMGE